MKFSDSKGRVWNVQLNFRTLCRIEDETEWKVLERPFDTPTKFREWGVIAGIVLGDQIEKQGITPDDFAEGMMGEQFQFFIEALITELAVFFKAPKPEIAAVLEEGLKLQAKVAKKQEEIIRSGCEQASLELLEQLESNPGLSPSGS